MNPSASLRTPSPVLSTLILSLLAINLPLFLDKVLPFRDTFFDYQQFYVTYNELFFHGSFPMWLPYSLFGSQADLFLVSCLSPASFLAIALGLILNVRDVYLLFKLSLFLEQLAFLYGTYLLCRRVFARNTTVLFVCLNVIGTISLLQNINFNFRLYYMLPLIFYLVHRAFAEYRLIYLLQAGIAFVFQCVGIVPYMSVVPLLVITVLLISYLLSHSDALPRFLSSVSQDARFLVILLLILLCISTTYVYFVIHALDQLTVLSPGRDPLTGHVTLDTFYSYGNMMSIAKFIDLIIPIYTVTNLLNDENNVSLFSGIFSLFLLVCLIARARPTKTTGRPLVFGLVGITGLLGLLSIGRSGVVAGVLYSLFPGMKYYRHLGYVANLYKVSLPILAGFGLESWDPLQSSRTRWAAQSARLPLFFCAVTLMLDCYFAILAYRVSTTLTSNYISGVKYHPLLPLLFAVLALGGICLLYSWSNKNSGRLRSKAAVFIIFYEMLCLQILITTSFHHISKDANLDYALRYVREYRFENERTTNPPDLVAEQRMDFVARQHPLRDANMLNYVQWDRCTYKMKVNNELWWYLPEHSKGGLIDLRVDLINSNVYRMLRSTSEPIRNALDRFGCGSDAARKLRLTADVLFADGESTINRIPGTDGAAAHRTLLTRASLDLQTSWAQEPHRTAEGTIAIAGFSFGRLDADVRIAEGCGSWLLYADAWHPAWKAYVNGKPADLVCADLGFKAVRVPGGLSRVSFVFENKASKFCVYVFLFAGAVFMVGVVIHLASLLQQDH
jgi:hypothetical protein